MEANRNFSSFESFKEKFNKMAEFIYSDDLLLCIKNHAKMELYFFSGAEIVEIFKNYSVNKDFFLKLINRYEGNSLRIDRTALIENCNKKISLDFAYLQNSLIELVNRFDFTLHKAYVEYFANKDSKNSCHFEPTGKKSHKSNIKAQIFKELETLFNEFDKNFKALV